MNMVDRNTYYVRWLREHSIECNCGGPQYDTGHAPDCALELAWDHAMAAYDEEKAESEREATWDEPPYDIDYSPSRGVAR